MVIDLTNVEHFVVVTAGLVLTACVPLVSGWLREHLHAATNSALSTDLDNAVTGAARLAIDTITNVAEQHRTLTLHNDAIGDATHYAINTAPAAVKALGITPSRVAAMVRGEVAKVLGDRPLPPAKVVAVQKAPAA